MKQKLLLLSVVLGIIVSVAQAWTGKDNSWWQNQGYTSSQQEYYQTTLRTSASEWALGIVPSQVVTTESDPTASALTLDWTAYDEMLDSIKEVLDAGQTLLPTQTYTSIDQKYQAAITLKKDAERDWHSVAFSFGSLGNPGGADYQTGGLFNRTYYYFVYRYPELHNAYTAAIKSKVVELIDVWKDGKNALAAEEVRLLLADKITAAETEKATLTDADALQFIEESIATATTLKDKADATADELTNGITAIDTAVKTARWMDDRTRLAQAMAHSLFAIADLTTPDALQILKAYLTKAESMMKDLNSGVNTLVTTQQVTAMVEDLEKSIVDAQALDMESKLTNVLADAAPYAELIPTEIAAAKEAFETDTMDPVQKNAAADALNEAIARAAAYTAAKTELTEAIAAAELSEEPTAELTQALNDAKTAVAKAFVDNSTDASAIVMEMQNALAVLDGAMDNDRWSHKPIAGKFVVQPWKSNNPDPNQVQYLKLVGRYTSADYATANSGVDLFLTGVDNVYNTFQWAPFAADTEYKANAITVSSEGVDDLNNYTSYGWSYNEKYNDIVIKSSTIFGNALTPHEVIWGRVWNTNDINILDKDAQGNYYGRYYTFQWSENNKGGVYRVPTQLSIYDETGDVRKVKDMRTYISKPSTDGTYFVNTALSIYGGSGYDNSETFFDYNDGKAVLYGNWHHVQFIDKNQFLFHQAAQKAADWYNNSEDLSHYDTEALEELRKAVETDGVDWLPQADRIKAAMEKVQNSINKVNMLVGDSLYGVIAGGDYADVERTYTVTGAPGDKIEPLIIAQTNDGWAKDDKQYWEITAADTEVGNDSTATIKVKFNPGTNYPADYREYRAVLDVKVGNLNYQDAGKDSLQQNLYGANPKLSLKENTLLQAHSLNLHRKDSITYDLYGRGYAHLYEKSPLTAKFYSETGLLLAESEVKTTLVKNEFTAYAVDNDLDQTKFTVSYYPEDLGVDVVKVVISDTIRQADDIVLTVNAAKSQITFDPATVTDVNQNSIKLDKMADGTDAYFFPADGETYLFPITIANFEGVNANTVVANEDGVISITTEKIGADGLVEEHLQHKVQVTIDNREYYTVEADVNELNTTGEGTLVISVKTKDLEQGVDDGQHDGLLQVIWQDQDTIKINLNQTQPYFSEIVDAVDGNEIWEFTEKGDKVWYVDVKDVDNYYNFAANFGTSTNTDWFIVDPAVSYQLTSERGTRRYRLKIAYNPHEANTVYNDVLTLNIFDSKRNVLVATKTLQLKGDAVSSVKDGATGVNNAQAEEGKKDGKYLKNGRIVIVKGGQEYNAVGAQMK
ncbi:MAG: hypothetical protein IKN75_09920 [Prevotella sp.]|nr:hypothetical protein [Prevotella sp.]